MIVCDGWRYLDSQMFRGAALLHFTSIFLCVVALWLVCGMPFFEKGVAKLGIPQIAFRPRSSR